MIKTPLIPKICIVLFSMFFLTGCSFIHSYTYYELDSEGFDTECSHRFPNHGYNYYLPIKDNEVTLYRDSKNNKDVSFTCNNDFQRQYSCGPLCFPVFPLFGFVTRSSHKPLSTLSMKLWYRTCHIEYDLEAIQVHTPDGKTYPVRDIDTETRFKYWTFIEFEAYQENDWYDSFQIDLGEITVDDSITVHPLIQFDKDTIMGFSENPWFPLVL